MIKITGTLEDDQLDADPEAGLKPLGDRPLVTFAVFAYNQEKYIREAVKGAFAQTYQPVEIILSDDCSTDKTFEIMKKMASKYKGPHSVKVVQTEENLGVIKHVRLRGKEALGEIVVVAAGDDISLPNRCEAHLKAYSDESVMAVSTGYNLIDHRGITIKPNVVKPPLEKSYQDQISLFKKLSHQYRVIQGSTASYRKPLFDYEINDTGLTYAEDNLFNFLIYALGFRVECLSESLINYRTHSDALGNWKTVHGDVPAEEKGARNAAIDTKNKMDTFLWIERKHEVGILLNRREILRRRALAATVVDWSERGLASRTFSLAISTMIFDLISTKWKIARLFGAFPFYQPNMAIKKIGRRRH
jgi:glycosyltransferase involved in cell wall biosynthesis